MADTNELDKTIEELEAELVRMKDRIERRTRSRHAKEDALEFAKFLKLL